jgi:tetratricopeptide (TPR) repeat protein
MLHSTCRLFHGDISARNVLLGRNGHVYLADLGLAEHNHPYGMRRGDGALVLWRNTGGEAPEMKEGDRGYDSTAEVSRIKEGVMTPAFGLTPVVAAQVWAWGVVFASLLAKRRLYSGWTGQELLEQQLGAAQGVESVLEEVKAAWGGERVPGGALEVLRWSICRDRDLRASWGTLLAKLARDGASSSSASSSPATFTAAEAAAEYVRGLSEGERELIGMEEAIEGMAAGGGAELGRLWLQKGTIHGAMEQHVQAERAYQAALATQRAHLPPHHPHIATSLNNLAALYRSKGEYDRALPLYEEALEMVREALPPGHPSIATSLNNLAALYRSKGEYDRALPLHEEALEQAGLAVFIATGPPQHRPLAQQPCSLVQVQGPVRPGAAAVRGGAGGEPESAATGPPQHRQVAQ